MLYNIIPLPGNYKQLDLFLSIVSKEKHILADFRWTEKVINK